MNASSQAMAITKLEPFLTDTEKDFLRKGRNKAGRGPKNVDAGTYAIATGFETIVGWLFLKNWQKVKSSRISLARNGKARRALMEFRGMPLYL